MIIHFVWVGDNPLPLEYINNLGACKGINPDHDVVLWTKPINMINRNLYEKEKCPAAKADLLRLELIYNYGGVYSDLDILWMKPIEDLRLGDKVTIVRESEKVVNNAFIYAPKRNHYLIRDMIDRCEGRSHHQLIPAKYGPGLMCDVYRDFKSEIDVISNRIICNPMTTITSQTVAYHGYRNSWI